MKSVEQMVNAICKEMDLQKNILPGDLGSIYFGGGTPSVLAASEINLILNQLRKKYNVAEDAEITLEANPDDISSSLAADWHSAGINRVSVGVQSFDNEVLIALNRSHDGNQALRAIENLKTAGINNITMDLIYGIPDQSPEQWQKNLELAINQGIQHLSCYALTIEEKTAFGSWHKAGKIKEVSEESYEQDYLYMCKYLSAKGYEHYEVSNFCLPNYRSKHNTSYWNQEPYIGLGPGAHSYNGSERYFNISNNASYIKSIDKGEIPNNSEHLSQSDLYNEYILTHLRTTTGINLELIKQKFGIEYNAKQRVFLQNCYNNSLLVQKGAMIFPTEKGLFMADSIILELMTS